MRHLSIVSLLDANIYCGPMRGVSPLLGLGRRRAIAVVAGEEACRRYLGRGRRHAAASWAGGGGAPPLLGAGEEVRRCCLGLGRRHAATSSGPGRARLGGQERGRAEATVPGLRLLLEKETFRYGTLLHSATYILQWVWSLRSHCWR